MGRKKLGEPVSARLDEATYKALETHANKTGITVSLAMRQAAMYFVKHTDDYYQEMRAVAVPGGSET